MSEKPEADLDLSHQDAEENIDEVPRKVGPENTKELNVEKEEKPEKETDGDFVVSKPEITEEKENSSDTKPIYDIPIGRSKAGPETNEEEFDEVTPKTAGRKKSVYLESVVNKTIIDILEDLKEIHSVSYQKEVKRTSKKIGQNIIFLKETLKGNI
ncbi:hypothetical protein [Methanococcus maripaludis]|uniref:Uncharacterized protein n=2 Tax=Methanococcus maripaludis TaxID=39152 RepID=A0A7J9PJV6_METMI|nr:hypothetical protein [Methanococcus maripaludis]MBA2861809.1 hypothetical protein [Methanococcus maripaludis]